MNRKSRRTCSNHGCKCTSINQSSSRSGQLISSEVLSAISTKYIRPRAQRKPKKQVTAKYNSQQNSEHRRRDAQGRQRQQRGATQRRSNGQWSGQCRKGQILWRLLRARPGRGNDVVSNHVHQVLWRASSRRYFSFPKVGVFCFLECQEKGIPVHCPIISIVEKAPSAVRREGVASTKTGIANRYDTSSIQHRSDATRSGEFAEPSHG